METVRSMRVLSCAFTCCPPGKLGFSGGEDVLGWNLVCQVAKHHEVWILTDARNRESIEEGLSESSLPRAHFIYVDLPSIMKPLLKFQGGHQFYYYFWQVKAYFTARRAHKNIEFDLFHHITYANDWMVNFIGALLPVVYVRGPGGGAHRTPKGLLSEYPKAGRIWESVRSIGQWLFRHDPLFVTGQNRAAALLVCNKEAMEELPPSWSEKATMFPVNGISDNDLVLTTRNDEPHSEFRVMSAGTLIRVKGFALAIKAFHQFQESHENSKFTIFGDGPEAPRLKSLIQSLGLSGKVELRPGIPRDALLREMADHDVFLFPSLRDGGGAVVVEAMAAGTPVLCLDVGGPAMHVSVECGIKVIPSSPHQAIKHLAEGLTLLHDNTELRQRMGAAGRQKVSETYSWDALGNRLMTIYDSATAM